jgi:hypothetical protein
MKTLRFAIFIAAVALNACGAPSAGSSAMPAGGGAALRPQVTVKKFLWISVTGNAGQNAAATCPSGYRLVGGGSSSVDGSAVGIGWGKPAANTWYVQPGGKSTQAISIASCVSTTVPKAAFKWRLNPSGGGVATVQCPAGYVLVSGFALITASGQQITKTYVKNGNAFFVDGGASAGASCGRGASGVATFTTWNASQDPKQVFASCPTGFSVIGGNSGTSDWPGPPIQQHRGTSTPGVAGSAGWWVLSNGKNVVSYAVCVPNGT